MSRSSRNISFIILVVVLVWTLTSDGDLVYYIDPRSIYLFGGMLLGGLWLCFGPRIVIEAIAKSMRGQGESDPKKLAIYLAVFNRAYQFFWGGGLVGMIVGLVVMLQNMDDASKIGPGMAIALLTVFFGAFLAEFVINPLNQVFLIHSTGDQTSASSPLAHAPRRSMVAVGSTVTGLVLVTFFVMLAALSDIRKPDSYAAGIDEVETRLDKVAFSATAHGGAS